MTRRRSDKERKAMFANMGVKSNPNQIPPFVLKNMSSPQLKKSRVEIIPDADKDNVPNSKDCRPLDPKKQGFLHDLQVKRLRKKEEKLEIVREKEQKKLEDLKDRLKERQAVATKEQDIKKIELQQKQSIIDEINKEKQQSEALRKENKEAKMQLDKLTVTGRTKTQLIAAGKATSRTSLSALRSANAFLNKDSTKQSIRNASRSLSNAVLGTKFKKEKKKK